mmetsp:Transcript_36045/g.53761  ORF Transcript_36045/g.53761 Transcript_36045/m.53761 type:complete len:629 (-) Transcript_36045:297-2183(-)
MTAVGAIVKASRVASSRRQAMNVITAASVRSGYTSSKVQMVIKATNNYVSNTVNNTSQTKTQQATSSTGSTAKSVVGQTAASTQNPTSSRIISSSRIFSSLAAAPIDSDTIEEVETQKEKSLKKELTKDLQARFFLTSLTDSEIFALANLRTTPLSLRDMFRYASWPQKDNPQKSKHRIKKYLDQRLRNAQFLHRELPIRFAQRAVDLLTLPHGLNKTTEVRGVANVYLSYLQKFLDNGPPTNQEEEREFTNMLESLVLDQTSIPLAVASGVRTLKDVRREDLDLRRLQEMEDALYRFFTARVGLRFLTEHHILSNPYREKPSKDDELKRRLGTIIDDEDNNNAKDDFLGCIQKDCDPFKEVRRVAAKITKRCRECYGIAPEIEILDTTSEKNASLEFTYVPHHLRYMLAELLKNSCRATVRSYLKEISSREDQKNTGSLQSPPPTLAPIRVIVTKGDEDVSIKIADQGGGVPRSAIKDMWTFAHFTQDDHQDTHESNTEFENDEITGGQKIRGFGLPLARIYARYFGGELTLKSMEGYGVDAYLYLPVLGVACENLPEKVVMSPGNLDSSANASRNDDGEDDDDVYDKSADRTTPDSSRIGDDLLWRRQMGTPSARQTFEMLARRAL